MSLAVGTLSSAVRHAHVPTAAAVPVVAADLVMRWKTQCKVGPLSLLRQLHRQRVRVILRRRHGLRGWCEGLVQLYDRHLNLLLGEATEHVAAFANAEDNEPAWRWVQRTASQLFVRGDCIVSVCSAANLPECGLGAGADYALLQRAANASNGLRERLVSDS